MIFKVLSNTKHFLIPTTVEDGTACSAQVECDLGGSTAEVAFCSFLLRHKVSLPVTQFFFLAKLIFAIWLVSF